MRTCPTLRLEAGNPGRRGEETLLLSKETLTVAALGPRRLPPPPAVQALRQAAAPSSSLGAMLELQRPLGNLQARRHRDRKRQRGTLLPA